MNNLPPRPAPADSGAQPASIELLEQILADERVDVHFQAVMDLRSAQISGYEGLVRGPEWSPVRSPEDLFRLAQKHGATLKLERVCRRAVLKAFSERGCPGLLFLNVRPHCLALPGLGTTATVDLLNTLGIAPERIVIELTETVAITDFESLRVALAEYRKLGLDLAIDDLGEGFSSLRLWSEIRPEYVKVDMHFVRDIDADPLKLEFLRCIQQLARTCGSRVIVEGVETDAELAIVRDLRIPFAQGFLIGKPVPSPTSSPTERVLRVLNQQQIAVFPETVALQSRGATAANLLIEVRPVDPDTPNDEVFARFESDPSLHAIPVVDHAVPVGLLDRHEFLSDYARPYRRELYGRRPCRLLLGKPPLIVDKDLTVQELAGRVASAESFQLSRGFILTDHGRYAGLGTSQDLVREITRLQIMAARYANPLTLLPGNVPINEHIERLLEARTPFVACHCDLDHFKPFNDHYGYRRGDDVIQLAAQVLAEACDPRRDFIGHVGGDDFILLVQSPDWEARCTLALARFDAESAKLYDQQDRQRGGIRAEDRRGNPVEYPLCAMSIGVVQVEPGSYASHYEVSAAASEAKRQAKRIAGSTLFVERRRISSLPPSSAD